MKRINNPVRDLTPMLNELEKSMDDESKKRINAILDSIKPLQDAPRTSDEKRDGDLVE